MSFKTNFTFSIFFLIIINLHTSFMIPEYNLVNIQNKAQKHEKKIEEKNMEVAKV